MSIVSFQRAPPPLREVGSLWGDKDEEGPSCKLPKDPPTITGGWVTLGDKDEGVHRASFQRTPHPYGRLGHSGRQGRGGRRAVTRRETGGFPGVAITLPRDPPATLLVVVAVGAMAAAVVRLQRRPQGRSSGSCRSCDGESDYHLELTGWLPHLPGQIFLQASVRKLKSRSPCFASCKGGETPGPEPTAVAAGTRGMSARITLLTWLLLPRFVLGVLAYRNLTV